MTARHSHTRHKRFAHKHYWIGQNYGEKMTATAGVWAVGLTLAYFIGRLLGTAL